MNNPAQDKINSPIAQIALKTFGIPTASTQAGIAKTKIVLNTLRKNVSAVSASPIISARNNQPMNRLKFERKWKRLTIISIQHISQRQTLQWRSTKVADPIRDSNMRPVPTIRQRIRKIPRSAALERDERQEAVEAVFRLVDASVAFRQS